MQISLILVFTLIQVLATCYDNVFSERNTSKANDFDLTSEYSSLKNSEDLFIDYQKEIEKRLSIAFYLQDGVEVLDFAGPLEILSYAGYNIFTVSKNKNAILSQGVLRIVPDYALKDAPQADIIAFFGGGISKTYRDEEVLKWIEQQKSTQYFFSVCTGAFVLAEAEKLNNKSATTFHSSIDLLQQEYPEIDVQRNVRFIDNGKVITTAGISAGIDGALHLVAKFSGFNEARRIAYSIEYDKWNPKEGLLLSGKKAYKRFLEKDNLLEYIGKYEYAEERMVEVIHDEPTNSLFAIIDMNRYPIYYQFNDRFKTVDGFEIEFRRSAKNEVNGYEILSEKAFFKKLE